MDYRRRGNPGLDKHFMRPVGDVVLRGHLQLRIEAGDLAKLKSLPNWREVLRAKIAELIHDIDH